jgi:hypothetical protein
VNLFEQLWCAIRKRCTVVFPGDDFTDYLQAQRDAASDAAETLRAKQSAIDDAFFPPRRTKGTHDDTARN